MIENIYRCKFRDEAEEIEFLRAVNSYAVSNITKVVGEVCLALRLLVEGEDPYTQELADKLVGEAK